MIIEDKIKEIHASDAYGSIFEFGNGACITNELLTVPGGTQTIYEATAPYSKKVQEKRYGKNKDERSVSKEFIYRVLRKEFLLDEDLNIINFALASSFQLQGENDNVLTHGYIGFANHETIRIYHVSIPEKLERAKYFELIAGVAIEIMYAITFNVVISSPYIDMAFRTEDGITYENLYNDTFEILHTLPQGQDNFIVFNEHHDFIRFEDLVRGKQGVILLKGSFNPIHERHVQMIEDAKNEYPDYAYAFFISIRRFDKPPLTNEELEVKVSKITSLGYPVVINTNEFFVNCVSWIAQRWKIPVIFPAGIDTLNRWVDSERKNIEEMFKSIPELIRGRPEQPREAWSDKPKPIVVTDDDIKHWIDVFYPNKHFKFLIFDRLTYALSKNAELFKDFYEMITPSVPDDGISSTKIRNGEYQTKL